MYLIHDTVILRTPKNSFEIYQKKDSVVNKFSRDNSDEAIFIASSELYHSINHAKVDSAKNLRAVSNYFSRSCFRCTPFGLFAGVTAIKFSQKTQIIFDGERRFSRLDMSCLFELANQLSHHPDLISHLKFRPNNSIYKLFDNIRYIESCENDGKRFYTFSQIHHSKELLNVLRWSKDGLTLTEIKNRLISSNPEILPSQADGYLSELISNQVLISEMEPEITGENFIDDALNIISKVSQTADLANKVEELYRLKTLIKNLDERGSNDNCYYQEILDQLGKLKVSYHDNKVFQVDFLKMAANASLDEKLKQKLLKGVHVLSKLIYTQPPNNAINKFIQRFAERYDGKVVPILQALDSESGIGYPDNVEDDITSLTQDVFQKKNASKNIPVPDEAEWLVKKLHIALHQNQYSVDINDDDIATLPSFIDRLPDSISAMFRITNFQDNSIYLESVGGQSALPALGRFAYMDDTIQDLITEIAEKEREKHIDKVFAEVIHVPETRLGNIMTHPSFYDYEIPYLAKSSKSKKYQLQLSDLFLALRNGKIKLFSKKLRKEVIPKLSNAHRFTLSELPVYQFLCDLQNQDRITSLTFKWPNSKGMIFLPRLTLGKLTLHAASWNFGKDEWRELTNRKELDSKTVVKEFRLKWRLPRYILLVENDNELYVDFEDPETVSNFLHRIRNKQNFKLKEFLFDPNTLVIDGLGQKYMSQFVASFSKKSSIPNKISHPKDAISQNKQTRVFAPGSEWIYFKYYCGQQTADNILVQKFNPVIKKLLKLNLIDSWFFVRYKDPHPHIRIRFHVKEISHTDKILEIHNKYFDRLLKSDLIWKIQIDTYVREIERYGHNSIMHSEQIFYHDSIAVMRFLEFRGHLITEQEKWLWAIYAIDDLMNNFKFTFEEKLELMQSACASFATEFLLDKLSKFNLDKKYRLHRADVIAVLNNNNLDIELIRIIKRRAKAMSPIILEILRLKEQNNLTVTLSNLIRSYIHMFLNRLIPSGQRLHERVIYDFMNRYYLSIKMRN